MAFIIVVYHSILVGYNVLPGGGIATEFFFITTGALMNRTLIRNNNITLWEYIKNKYTKIFPLFILSTFSVLVINVLCGFRTIKGALLDIIDCFFDLLFLRMAGFSEKYYINPVTWYLSAMLLAIILLYPLAKQYRELCAKWVFPIVTIALSSYLIKNYGTLVTVSVGYSFFTLDLVKRAIAEMCLEFSMYEVAFYIGKKVDQYRKMYLANYRNNRIQQCFDCSNLCT